MARRALRRIGRSTEERRRALEELKQLWDLEHRRIHRTVEQLRFARITLEHRLSSAGHQRRAEDLIRDDYHDSRARIVTSAKKR